MEGFRHDRTALADLLNDVQTRALMNLREKYGQETSHSYTYEQVALKFDGDARFTINQDGTVRKVYA